MYVTRLQTASHQIFVWFVEHHPRVRVARKRIQEFYDLPECEVEYGIRQMPLVAEPKLEFNNIEYHYPSGKSGVVNLSFNVPYNTRIALAGGIGSGKSVLPRLILRDFEPSGGEILYSGVCISSINRTYMRNKLFSYCGPNPLFMPGTIRENMKMLSPHARDEDIINVFKDLEATDFIKRFGGEAEFLDYKIVDQFGLSNSAIALLNVVRSTLKNAPIHIYNQCFEHVRREYVENLMKYLRREKRTCLFISYDAAVCRNCNKVYVVKSGRVAATGRHMDLLKSSADYKRFYASTTGSIREENEEVLAKKQGAEVHIEGMVIDNVSGGRYD
jgi:ABC-type multidrug transport system fused ATPase/permease subunit